MIGIWSSECECMCNFLFLFFLVKDKRFGFCMMIRLDDMFILQFGDACGGGSGGGGGDNACEGIKRNKIKEYNV